MIGCASVALTDRGAKNVLRDPRNLARADDPAASNHEARVGCRIFNAMLS